MVLNCGRDCGYTANLFIAAKCKLKKCGYGAVAETSKSFILRTAI